MKLLLLLLAAASTATAYQRNFTQFQYKLRYDVFHQISGVPIEHEYPAYVELSTTPAGDIRVDVGAVFFNSPNRADTENFRGKCPANPYYYYDLYDYNEVVELFFAYNGTRYLELAISPRGQYVVNLKDGKDNCVVNRLSLAPYGVQVHNPCFVDGVVEKDCAKPWTATAVIPRNYLPANVTKFNAHFLHGKVWGEADPARENLVVESLYPSLDNKAAVINKAGQGEHYYGAFHAIDLASIGYVQQTEFSDLWVNATEHRDFVFKYNVSYTSDCEADIASPEYVGEVVVTKSTEFKKIFFYVKFADKAGLKPSVPDALRVNGSNPALNYDSESVWFNYRGEGNESVRFGVNPYGAFLVQLRDDVRDVVLDQSQALLNVNFALGSDANYEGTFEVPYAFLPPSVSDFQVVHFHRVVEPVNVDAAKAAAVGGESKFDFVGAVFPGFRADQVDWRGAGFDYRAVIDPEDNKEYSPVWSGALVAANAPKVKKV
jgi:hypothetical protein